MASVGFYRKPKDRAYPGVGTVSAHRGVVASEIEDEVTKKKQI